MVFQPVYRSTVSISHFFRHVTVWREADPLTPALSVSSPVSGCVCPLLCLRPGQRVLGALCEQEWRTRAEWADVTRRAKCQEADSAWVPALGYWSSVISVKADVIETSGTGAHRSWGHFVDLQGGVVSLSVWPQVSTSCVLSAIYWALCMKSKLAKNERIIKLNNIQALR